MLFVTSSPVLMSHYTAPVFAGHMGAGSNAAIAAAASRAIGATLEVCYLHSLTSVVSAPRMFNKK